MKITPTLVLISIAWTVAMPLAATSDVNFFNIKVARDGGRMTISAEAEPMMTYKVMKDDRYFIDEFVYNNILDAPFRQTAFLMRTLERNRGAIYKQKDQPLPIISYKFELAVRDIAGEPIRMIEYQTIIGLSPEAGQGLITCEAANLSYTFPIARLTQPAVYQDFINHIVFPFGQKQIGAPAVDEYLVDLYFKWPEVEVKKSDFSVIDLFPSLILWDRGPIRKLWIHLGSTYCFRRDGEWQEARSDFLRSHKDAINAYTNVLAVLDSGDKQAAIVALEEYIATAPDDRKALKHLMDLYLAEFKHDEAFDLISRFQPFFATIRGGLPNQKDLAAKAQRRRNWLLGIRGSFERNPDALVKISSPAQGDLVTGSTDLEFSVVGGESPLLQVDCYVDEQLIASLANPPFKARFTVDGSLGKANLRVVAYFEDKTYQQDEISVDTLAVDQEERVNLVAIRASVFQEVDKARALTKDDFEILENRVPQKIERFRKDEAPLRVAILLDTSVSMFGEKLHRTQYAVKTFLSKLSPEDRVSIYSFNSRVVKLSEFTNDFDGVAPQLMTLSPQGNTSLYDAMLIAHDALLGQNGTKVMIIISDGEDSSSATTDLHVAKVLRRSPVMVYSVIMPDTDSYGGRRGSYFLKEMARLSGSIHTRVRRVKLLDETFDRIYQDLKSLYYMDYYSELTDAEQRDIRVKVRSSGSKVRHRALN